MSWSGQPSGEQVELDGEVFALPLRTDILQRCVEYHRAKRRKGMYKSKDRSEVKGSGKKMWRQKGTGRARVGDKRPPHWRHGGKAHGPVLRSFAIELPRKVRALGLKVALSARVAEGRLIVVASDTLLESGKTQAFRKSLDAFGVGADERFVFIGALDVAENLRRASRNLIGSNVMNSVSVTTLDVLRAKHVLITADAVAALTARLTQAGLTSPIDHRSAEQFVLFETRMQRHEQRLAKLAAAADAPANANADASSPVVFSAAVAASAATGASTSASTGASVAL
jgi:large subunit ribosomal protein L4